MIVVTPGDIPVTTPEDEPTVAIDVLALVHIPPVGEAGNVRVLPTHTCAPVDIPITGVGFTVIVVVAKQPVDNIYVITTVPADTPVTTPDDEPTTAIDVLLLLQVPPDGEPASVIVLPTHTCVGPDMVGVGLTVITTVVKHPPGNV